MKKLTIGSVAFPGKYVQVKCQMKVRDINYDILNKTNSFCI